ncbi:hypothetical protein SDC9_20240 [bioreactor metagenome]|uniref:Uncharacterized protein n=1 Tax=bioreactor metagenome TaxID=1076179 RepID=A0A644U675_9ZZZZ
MKKQVIKDIATALIATTGMNFDLFAFEDSSISDSDTTKIMEEIQYQCKKMIIKVENRLQKEIPSGSTKDIIDTIYN